MRLHSKYNATLHSAGGLTDEQRQTAEQKFLEVLEHALGGASAVRGAYVEWTAVRSMRAENPGGCRSSEELQAIARWEQATEHATRAVFRQMQIAAQNAFFELEVWNSRTH
ncbi:MAG: hypothetical protein PSV26_11110 [Polaromonas sp.]|uniref:hypothetical protein n=1 Tax=Polaromonas sp. TaxID=1869339 RepID=UPI0024882357|nr:hypothetical protein [Polaromonas sp.]MDI1238020.1 hypothetical protein [Polaromonas sp.]MDI1338759.1 hypothetical protein [Polaromonas sp.]